LDQLIKQKDQLSKEEYQRRLSEFDGREPLVLKRGIDDRFTWDNYRVVSNGGFMIFSENGLLGATLNFIPSKLLEMVRLREYPITRRYPNTVLTSFYPSLMVLQYRSALYRNGFIYQKVDSVSQTSFQAFEKILEGLRRFETILDHVREGEFHHLQLYSLQPDGNVVQYVKEEYERFINEIDTIKALMEEEVSPKFFDEMKEEIRLYTRSHLSLSSRIHQILMKALEPIFERLQKGEKITEEEIRQALGIVEDPYGERIDTLYTAASGVTSSGQNLHFAQQMIDAVWDFLEISIEPSRVSSIHAKNASQLTDEVLKDLKGKLEGIGSEDLIRNIEEAVRGRIDLTDPILDDVIRQIFERLSLPSPKSRASVADFIGKDFVENVRAKLANEGYSQDFIRSIVDFLQDSEISGAVWINPRTGRVEGSRLFIRLLDRLATLAEPERYQSSGSRVRECLVHEYMHQILGEVLSYVEKEGLRRKIEDLYPDFLEKFLDRYGTQNIEEVLAKFLSLEFVGRARGLEVFGKVRKHLEAFLEGKKIYEINIPREKAFREAVLQADEDFFERFQKRFGTKNVKTIFLKYRQLKLLFDEGRLNQQERADLELFNRIQIEMDMNLGEKVSLIDFIRGKQPQKVLSRLAKQVHHKIDLEKGERIDQKIRNIEINLGLLRSPRLKDSQKVKKSIETAA
jgi:hypothetical protein